MKIEKKCKKIIFASEFEDGKPVRSKCLIGIVTEDQEDFIRFRTARNEILINKDFIISISDTDINFREDYVK